MDENSEQQLAKINKELDLVIQKLVKHFGPAVFDYLVVFTKEKSIQIKLPERIAPIALQNLNLFFVLVDAQNKFYNIPNIDSEGLNLSEKFQRYSQDLFLTRYSEALMLFGSYALYRIPTLLEREIIKQTKKPAPDSFSLKVEDEVVLTLDGRLDIRSTIQKEITKHGLASVLSSAVEIQKLSRLMLIDIQEISFRGNVFLMYKNEMQTLCEKISDICLLYFTKEIYKYLYQNMRAQEALENVFEYYNRSLIPPYNSFPTTLADLESKLLSLLNPALNSIRTLTPETRKDILNEFMELVILYIREKRFKPQNFYKLEFMAGEEFDPREKLYSNVLLTYFIEPSGKVQEIPLEAYKFDLSEHAKVQIFDYVTQGVANPQFTLPDYLAE